MLVVANGYMDVIFWLLLFYSFLKISVFIFKQEVGVVHVQNVLEVIYIASNFYVKLFCYFEKNPINIFEQFLLFKYIWNIIYLRYDIRILYEISNLPVFEICSLLVFEPNSAKIWL